ncbi:hypothetical protein ACFLV5_06195, partial [Chloroflexota bacterium]
MRAKVRAECNYKIGIVSGIGDTLMLYTIGYNHTRYNIPNSGKQELKDKTMSQKSPSLVKRLSRFILMTIGLGVLGIVFGVLGALIGGNILGSDSFGFGALGLAIGGLLIGYPTGIIVGIILIRKILHQQGSLLLGIVGSIIGAVITVVLAEP